MPCQFNKKVMADQILPNNDPDLQLARRIGSLRQSKTDADKAEDPLLQTLFQYKEQRSRQGEGQIDYNRQDLWEKISIETQPTEEAKIYQLDRSGTKSATKTVLAAAASILIAAFIGIYYYSMQPEVIASSTGSIQTVALEDGSKVTLRPHSTIYALSGTAEELNYEIQGEAYFEVNQNAERTFSVKAGNGKVSVLGTKFNLSTWGSQVQVFLEEGTISFENIETDSSVTLNPGESAEIDAGKTIITDIADVTEFTDWMNRELIFNNKTARYIFNEMEQEFSIIISAPDSIQNTELSGELSLEDAEQSLKDLSLVLNGQFVSEGNNRFKFVPNQ